MAELGVAVIRADGGSEREAQMWLALGAALCSHLLFGLLAQLNYQSVQPLPAFETIDVRLIPTALDKEDYVQAPPKELEAVVPSASLEILPPEILPEPEPVDEVISTLAPVPQTVPSAPPITAAPPPILESESGTTRGAFPAQEAGKDYVPSQWALEPPLSDKNLNGLGLLDDVDCLRALSEDCSGLRKEVFAEFELTEMEKVWTPARADTGMPSEFYGLSEREIRLKIGSHIAGENGFMLLPGITIDGPIWDMMHGVKKGCGIKRGINSEGRYEVIKVCPESLPAARDKKYYIPPKE